MNNYRQKLKLPQVKNAAKIEVSLVIPVRDEALTIDKLFKECAAIAYVPIKTQMAGGSVRGPFIASSLVKREAWSSVGGFPDLRASEDLIFFEEIKHQGHKMGWAPGAVVHWELRAS